MQKKPNPLKSNTILPKRSFKLLLSLSLKKHFYLHFNQFPCGLNLCLFGLFNIDHNKFLSGSKINHNF